MHYNMNCLPNVESDLFYEKRIIDFLKYNTNNELPNNHKQFDDR
jgi:hypothetical protein